MTSPREYRFPDMRSSLLVSLLLATAAVAQAPAVVSPVAATSGTASSNWYPFGAGQMTYQQVHSASSFTSNAPRTVTALRLRPRTMGATATIDLELHMGNAPNDSMNVDRTFANNIVPGSEVNVFTRKNFALPNVSNIGWHVTIPFDNPFSWNGSHLEWRAIVHGNNNGNQPTHYAMDSWISFGSWGQTGTFAGCASAQGTQTPGQRVRIKSPGLVSEFTGFSYVPSGGLLSALNIGFSSTSMGGLPLPISLGPIGAPGCEITNDIRASLAGTTNADPEGSVDFQLPLPSDPRLSGATFYTQIVFLQPGANALGAFLTPGSTNVIGQNHGLTRVSAGYPATQGGVDLQWGLAIGLD